MYQLIPRMAPLLLLAALPAVATAQPGQTEESPWRLGVAMGYGERTNPLIQSEDIPIAIDLDIAWFGDRWFFDNGDAGLTFADNQKMTASAVGRINSDRVFFGRTNSRFVVIDAGLGPAGGQLQDFDPPDRDYAVELGIEVLTDGPWGAAQLAAYQDASGTHDGYELLADYSFGWRRQRLYIEPSLGVSYKSADMNDYYWGIRPDETRGAVAAYTAGAGFNWTARLTIAYQISAHWAVALVGEHEALNREAAASPLVAEDSVRGWFAGASWRF